METSGTEHAEHCDNPRDPREDEDWFLRLPVEKQDEIREAWHRKRTRFERYHQGRRKFLGRCLREGLLACGVPTIPLALFYGLQPLLIAVPTGLAMGWVWWYAGSGRLTSGILASAAMLAICGLGGAWMDVGTEGSTTALGLVVPVCGGTGVIGNPLLQFLCTASAVFLAGLLATGLGLQREFDESAAV